jgi:hypothetical protein
MASEVDQLVQSIANRRRAARIRGVVAGAAYGLACAIVFAIAKSRDESTLGDMLVLLAQSALVASTWVGYVVYARAASSREVLVWLRKFWPSRGRRMRFASVLGQASAGVTYPVTLQDDSFPTSYYAGGLRLWVLTPVLLFAWGIGLLLMGAFVLVAAGSVSHMSDSAVFSAAFFVLAVLYTVGFVRLIMKRLKHVGLRTLKADSAVREITDSLDKARQGRKYLGYGVEVFKCPRKPDNLWQEVVTTALKRASIVIIDVTKFKDSPPIQWELGQALSLRDPRDIILAVEEGTLSPDRIWNEICQPVLQSLGLPLSRSWLTDALFTYPAAEAHLLRRKQQYRQVTKALRKKILLRSAGRMLAGSKRVAHSRQ